MKPQILILIIITLILLTGCSNETIKEYINNTIVEYKDVIRIEYINTTQECSEEFSQEYVDALIRDYRRCRADFIFYNKTNMEDMRTMYYNLNVSLTRCEDEIEEIRDVLG